MIGQTISHFRILARIGGGGMGTVYKAEDTRLPGRIVALKLLNPELVGNEQLKKRFLLEAQTATSLDHPNICEIFEVDETSEGRLFMSMRYYGGATLRHRIAEAPLGALETFQIAYSISQGLHAAHRRDIIHRDIKPANIMVTEDGYVKIVDFGLAKLLGHTRVTASGVTVGTAAYMSPEQADGREVDGRTDIWSLGVVMYEMATGQLPFRGGIDQAMIYSILNEDITPVRDLNPDFPEECARVIEKCLAKDRDQRYANTEELLVDMHKTAETLGWSSDLSVATIAPVSWVAHSVEEKKKRRRRQRIVSSILTAAVIAVAAFLYVYFTGEDSPYVTDVRLAVMQLQNELDPSAAPLAAGLTDVITEMVEAACEAQESAWVLPLSTVRYANLPTAHIADEALGAGYVITGGLQRYQDGHRVTLTLVKTGSLDPISHATVDFDIEAPERLATDLAARVVELLEMKPAEGEALTKMLPANANAILPYLSGLGLVSDEPGLAVGEFELAASADPLFAPALVMTAWATFSSAAEPGARNLLIQADQAKRMAPDSPRVQFVAGELYRKLGEPDSAIACYESVERIRPWDMMAVRRHASVLRGQRRRDEASRLLHVSANSRTDCFLDYRQLGLHFFRSEQYDSARVWFQKALHYAPLDVYSLNALGAVFLLTGNWSEARQNFEASYRLTPTCDNCSNVGLVSYYEGRFDESARYYEYSLEYCDTTTHETWGDWASALYWAEGNRERATRIYAKAISIAEGQLQEDPGNADLLARLLDYNVMSGHDAEARSLIAELSPYAVDDADIMYRIGSAYEVMGERSRALQFIGDAVRHGYPRHVLLGTPVLADLVKDPPFRQLLAGTADSTGVVNHEM